MRLAIAVLALTCAAPAMAQTPCGKRGDIVKVLSEKYGEAPVFMGIDRDGNVAEIFGAMGGGTWTAIMTTPKGLTCIMAAGQSWEATPAKPIGKEM